MYTPKASADHFMAPFQVTLGRKQGAKDTFFSVQVEEARRLLGDPSLSAMDRWRHIWTWGALVDPLACKERIRGRMQRWANQRPSQLESAWWILAAYETYLALGDRHFLDEIRPVSMALLEQLSGRNAKAIEPPSAETDLPLAQAWRVVGWMNGLAANTESRDYSLYCENQFQKRYRQLQDLSSPPTPGMEFLMALWRVDQTSTSAQVPYAKWMETFSTDPAALAVTALLRDLLGIRLWPFSLNLTGHRACQEKSGAPLTLDYWPYRQAKIRFEVSGCGDRIDTFRVDGKRATQVAGDLEGEHQVKVTFAPEVSPL